MCNLSYTLLLVLVCSEFQTVTAGKFKRTLTPTKKVTKEDKKKSEEDIEQIFNLFKGWVGQNRPQLDIDVSYLSSDNVLRTQPV